MWLKKVFSCELYERNLDGQVLTIDVTAYDVLFVSGAICLHLKEIVYWWRVWYECV
jgi:hypothetical protein